MLHVGVVYFFFFGGGRGASCCQCIDNNQQNNCRSADSILACRLHPFALSIYIYISPYTIVLYVFVALTRTVAEEAQMDQMGDPVPHRQHHSGIDPDRPTQYRRHW